MKSKGRGDLSLTPIIAHSDVNRHDDGLFLQHEFAKTSFALQI
jgi:hypothetical protein